MSTCDRLRDDLERMAFGDPADAPAARLHVASCAACARELAWLRTERQLAVARRGAERLSPDLFAGIERRLDEERRERRLGWLGATAAALAACVVAAVCIPRAPREPDQFAAAPALSLSLCVDERHDATAIFSLADGPMSLSSAPSLPVCLDEEDAIDMCR